MRIDGTQGETASDLLARLSKETLAQLLVANADEPHAAAVARILKERPITTTHAAERAIRTGLAAEMPHLTKSDVKLSVRRTFQALRIAVNGEYGALEALLRALPACLAAGGRAAVLTFHSGEDRRVKQAFRAGQRAGVYSAIAKACIRSSKEETYSNRRAQAAKLRWAVRARSRGAQIQRP
jgi:16S rRNA (cytosine1402-N4)-methyltransferase